MLIGLRKRLLHVHGRSHREPQRLAFPIFRGFIAFSVHKWYFDELYDFLFVRPAFAIGRLFWKGGDGVIIDGFGPDGVSARVLDVARNSVRLQTGYVYHYAFAMLLGAAAASTTWYLRGGSRDERLLVSSPAFLALPLIGALFILLLPGDSEATKRERALDSAVRGP